MMRSDANPQDIDLSTAAFSDLVAGGVDVGVSYANWDWVDCSSGSPPQPQPQPKTTAAAPPPPAAQLQTTQAAAAAAKAAPRITQATAPPTTEPSTQASPTTAAIQAVTTTKASPTPLTTQTISTNVTQLGWNYTACYADHKTPNDTARLLSTLLLNSTSMTIELCAQTATRNNYTLFGVEYGSECWADVAFRGKSLEYSTQCTFPCAANATQTCGGPLALSVYTTSAYTYFGCYADPVKPLANGNSTRLLNNLVLSSRNMTVEYCAHLATSKNYTMFGVENAGECYADNAFAWYPLKASKDCFYGCTGNVNQTCGGGYAIDVFFNDVDLSGL
ncbi:hypothetical protein HDU98_004319 [Podochytrium sp. JEL0797]|nr:hypothetical protein HDU98_004319 [Podochytrium sp. JEL0797]